MIWNWNKPEPASEPEPKKFVFLAALKEEIPGVTKGQDGANLMKVVASDEADAREQVKAEAGRHGIVIRDDDVIEVRGGTREA